MSLEEVVESTKQTAEGVKSCRSVLDLARAHDIEVPITEAVVRVCHENADPARIVREVPEEGAKAVAAVGTAGAHQVGKERPGLLGRGEGHRVPPSEQLQLP